MKSLKCFLVSIALALTLLPPANAITPAEAAYRVGAETFVRGVVTEVHHDRDTGHIFINMGGYFPNHQFYGFIHRRNAGAFASVQSLIGSEISISGRIDEYRGRPQIVITHPSQITHH